MKFPFVVALAFLILLITGCQLSETKFNSIGKESEVLLVCTNDLAETAAVRSILSEMSSDYPALPQQENLLDVIRIAESDFSELFRRHKAIIKIEPSKEETRITVKRDEYANQQAVLTIKINDQQLSDSVAGRHLGKTAADFFIKEDRNIRIQKLRKAYDRKIAEIIGRNFGISLLVPEDFILAKNETNFIWLRRETSNTSSSLLIYSVPYSANPNAIALRDSLTRIQIPGPADGSFMIINQEFDPVIYSDSLLGKAAMITRGLWKMENDFMGGPFVNFCIPDSEQNRMVCIDAFVYAPKFDKREYVNRLMSIIYSAEKSN